MKSEVNVMIIGPWSALQQNYLQTTTATIIWGHRFVIPPVFMEFSLCMGLPSIMNKFVLKQTGYQLVVGFFLSELNFLSLHCFDLESKRFEIYWSMPHESKLRFILASCAGVCHSNSILELCGDLYHQELLLIRYATWRLMLISNLSLESKTDYLIFCSWDFMV